MHCSAVGAIPPIGCQHGIGGFPWSLWSVHTPSSHFPTVHAPVDTVYQLNFTAFYRYICGSSLFFSAFLISLLSYPYICVPGMWSEYINYLSPLMGYTILYYNEFGDFYQCL